MEILKKAYQELKENGSQVYQSQKKAKDGLEAMLWHKVLLKTQAREKIEEWKQMLDKRLEKVNKDIDQKLSSYQS